MEAGITEAADYVVIGLYFLFVITVGLLSMRRKNRESVAGYFLAGRSMTWLPIGASVFASNIGSEHFVGLAGSGAISGIGVVAFEWGAIPLLLLLGWLFLPIYLGAQVFTMPEYLKRRFGGTRIRVYLSLVALLLYVTTKVSVDMYAGVFFIQLATGWNMYMAMVPLLVVTALYTLAGGLAAVVFTETLQTIVMLVGAVVMAILAFAEVGGFDELFVKYMEAVAKPLVLSDRTVTLDNATGVTFGSITTTFDPSSVDSDNQFFTSNSTCGQPRHDAFHIFRDPVDSDLPWPGIIFRATLASLWNWCADQVIVQRTLAAKNLAHARGATVLAGCLKFTPLFLIIFPGMISRVLYTDEIACTTEESCLLACGNKAGCSNSAYPYLILRLAPVGVKGLLMAVMVAALMSSLTSLFNSSITIFTMDLWKQARPKAKDKELLIVGRCFVMVLAGVSIAWMPLIMESHGGQLFMYMQAVTGYIAPPISAIFILAILIPRINEKGAFYGMICGQIVGAIRLVLDFVYPSVACDQIDDRPTVVSKVHYAYFSMIVFGVTAVTAVLVSLVTRPQNQMDIQDLTFSFWPLRKSLDDGTHRSTKKNFPGTYKLNEYNEIHEHRIGRKTVKNNKAGNEDEKQSDDSQKFDPEQANNSSIQTSEISSSPQVNANLNKNYVQSGTLASRDDQVSDKIRNTVPSFKNYVNEPWNTFLNFNAVILMVILAFLCGFFH